MPQTTIDTLLFCRLWAEGAEIREIAERLGIAATRVSRERARLGLPVRPRKRVQDRLTEEPSESELAEIERRKLEVRERHFAQMRAQC